MFDPKVLFHLASHFRDTFKRLAAIEDELNRRFSASQEPIRALILAVTSGEPLLLVGPPGTGKSRLIRAFCSLVGLLDEEGQAAHHYFEYLLTPFTEPSELFGFYDVSKALGGELERREEGMMQHAKVVYLDEVFNGSSAILNSILAFMNERLFHDRGRRRKVAMQTLFAATNRIPQAPELRAVLDRFVLRCSVVNIEARVEPVRELLQAGWRETYGRHLRPAPALDLFDALVHLRETIGRLTAKGSLKPLPNMPFLKGFTQLIQHARQYDLSEMSNRRLVKMTYIMLIHRIYEAVKRDHFDESLGLSPAELQLIPRFFLDRFEEQAVQKMRRTVGE